MTRFERLHGCLVGGAVGDALGLPVERLSPARQKALYGRIDAMQFLPSRGMISDDTEHALFTARALVESGGDPDKFARLLQSEFRRWMLALPPGIGLATLKAGLKSLVFAPQTGVFSAGNGPAMRAPILGAALGEIVPQLQACLDFSTRMTHTDPKAKWAALAIALAASEPIGADGRRLVREFSEWSDNSQAAKECLDLLKKAVNSASRGQSTAEFCGVLGLQNGVSGYIFHTLPVVIQCFLRNSTDFRQGIEEIIACGGDSDTGAAILGGLLGAHLGIEAISGDWRGDLWDWPNTPRSMENLARDLAQSLDEGQALVAPRLILPYQLARNAFFVAVVLAHSLRRVAPPLLRSSAPLRLVSLSPFKLPLALAVAILSWACAWVSVRAAVAHVSPAHVALGRYLVASLVLLPLALWRRPRVERRDLGAIFAMGLCGFTFYNLCINLGEQTITAGAAALISSAIPIFSTLGARLFLGETIPKRAAAGIALGVAGVALIALGEKGGVGVSSGALLVVLATVFAAIYGLMQKRLLVRYNALDLTTFAIWAGTLALLPFAGGLGEDLRAAPASALGHIAFLGVFPGAIGYVLWSYCLSQWPVSRVTSFLYLVPAISIALGWAILGELPAPISLAGGALALCGVITTNWSNHG